MRQDLDGGQKERPRPLRREGDLALACYENIGNLAPVQREASFALDEDGGKSREGKASPVA